jgi:anti-anti-sigma regulatory factor
MEVKIDTKEKFHVITPSSSHLPANLTENIRKIMGAYLQMPVKNVVFNAVNVETMDEPVADCIAATQQLFYAQNASFVICCLQPPVTRTLKAKEYWQEMNVTPTESEAWDMIQMEEIERDLLKDDA